MENRWFQRTPARINVMIQYAPLGLVSGVTENISCLGMYIHTNSIILSCEENVDLSFRFPDNADGELFSIEAEIVHSDEKGAGLQFMDFQLMLPTGQLPGNPIAYPS